MESAANVDISKFVARGHVMVYQSDAGQGRSDHILLKMLEEGLHADVTLVAQGGSVKAHRSVLASRSPVFCAMFQSEMKEQRLSTVDIPDMTLDGLQLFLLLLYTANDHTSFLSVPMPMTQLYTAAIDKHFGEFWQAYHKYQVASRSLQSALVSATKRILTPENCWYWYDCSLQVDGRTRELSNACNAYILNNYNQVISSECLLVEMRRNPKRVYEFMKAAPVYHRAAHASLKRKNRVWQGIEVSDCLRFVCRRSHSRF